MNNKLMFSLIVSWLCVSCFTHAVHAKYRVDRDYYLGEIILVLENEDKITIYDYIDGVKRTFYVERGVGNDLKPGVEVMVSVLPGSDVAKRVKIIIPRNLNI